MTIDLNLVPDEESGETLPDLNEQTAHDGDDMHRLHEDEVHPFTGQSHYLPEEEHAYAHAIDLNVPACQGHEEFHHQGNISLNIASLHVNVMCLH
jgi:hypothetical protein